MVIKRYWRLLKMNREIQMIKDYLRKRKINKWFDRYQLPLTLLFIVALIGVILTGNKVTEWADAETTKMDTEEAEYIESINKSYEKLKMACNEFGGKVVLLDNNNVKCEQLTDTGKEALNAVLFEANKVELVKIAEEIITEEKENK